MPVTRERAKARKQIAEQGLTKEQKAAKKALSRENKKVTRSAKAKQSRDRQRRYRARKKAGLVGQEPPVDMELRQAYDDILEAQIDHVMNKRYLEDLPPAPAASSAPLVPAGSQKSSTLPANITVNQKEATVIKPENTTPAEYDRSKPKVGWYRGVWLPIDKREVIEMVLVGMPLKLVARRWNISEDSLEACFGPEIRECLAIRYMTDMKELNKRAAESDDLFKFKLKAVNKMWDTRPNDIKQDVKVEVKRLDEGELDLTSQLTVVNPEEAEQGESVIQDTEPELTQEQIAEIEKYRDDPELYELAKKKYQPRFREKDLP